MHILNAIVLHCMLVQQSQRKFCNFAHRGNESLVICSIGRISFVGDLEYIINGKPISNFRLDDDEESWDWTSAVFEFHTEKLFQLDWIGGLKFKN